MTLWNFITIFLSTVRHVFGENQAFSHLARDIAANALGALGARVVGDLRTPLDGTAGIDTTTRDLLHFCSGMISGSVKGGTACTIAGGVSSLVSERIAEAAYDGTNLNQAAKVGEIAGSLAGIMAGNADVGSMAAHNTIQNNLRKHIIKAAGLKILDAMKKYVMTKRAAKEAGSGAANRNVNPKPHGNSKEYKGETHSYVIRDGEGNIHKVGESMQGTDKFGLSRRAEQQVSKLEKETGQDFSSQIRKIFSTKVEAREYETWLIQSLRKRFGADMLPGNKGVH